MLWLYRMIAASAFAGSFSPIHRFGKLDVHKVRLRFPNLGSTKNLSPNALAESCGPACEISILTGREAHGLQAATVSISTSPGNQKKGEIFYGNAIDPVAGEGAAHRALSARQHPLFCRGPAVRLPRDGIQCPHAAGHPPDGGLHPRRGAAVAPGVSAAASAAAAGAEAPRAVARGRGRAAAGPAARLLQLRPAHAAFARVGVVRQAHPRRAV